MTKGNASKEKLETRSYDKKPLLTVTFHEFLCSAAYVVIMNDFQQNWNTVVKFPALFINTWPNY